MREQDLDWPPPDSSFLHEDIALERIRALTSTARTTWLVLLGFLAFIGTTLLSVRDVDFFSVDAVTQLPIVNIAIPTTTFFWTAALLAAILHTYFHVFLLKLWDALAEAPPEIGGSKLGDRVFPWLVNDWALRRRADRPVTKRPMDLLGSFVTALVIWLATPIVLAGFWWRSLPAHDARLSLTIAAVLLLTLFASMRSWRRARTRLASPGMAIERGSRSFLQRSGAAVRGVGVGLLWLAMLALVPALGVATLAGAGGHRLPPVVEFKLVGYWPEDWEPVPFVRADLIDAKIAIEPDDWRDREIARRRFHTEWCVDAGIPGVACETPEHPEQELARQRWCEDFEIDIGNGGCSERFREIDTAFEDAWEIERGIHIDNIRGPDLRGRDLRNADAIDAFLAGVDLREARLEEANLSGALLEEANLRGAQLRGTSLYGARLEGANLGGALLEEANLRFAHLQGSYLGGARLERTDLSLAQLKKANLSEVRGTAVELSGADLRKTIWIMAQLEDANLESARLEGAVLVGLFYEAILRQANFVSADLLGSFRRADFSGARLDGAILDGARLESADWAGAILGPSAAHSADFTGARNLTQTQLAKVIGNDDTILPHDAETGEQLYVWSCWNEEAAETFVRLRTQHRVQLTIDQLWKQIRRRGFLCTEGEAPRKVGTPAEEVIEDSE